MSLEIEPFKTELWHCLNSSYICNVPLKGDSKGIGQTLSDGSAYQSKHFSS